MSYSQSYDNEGNGGGGGGCMLLLLAAAAFALLMSMGGDDTHTHTTTDTRSGLLSGNQAELFSRNQVNLWSDVQNCYGDFSCLQVISTTTNTSSTHLTIDGSRNAVLFGDGVWRCLDGGGNWTPDACPTQGGQP